MPVEFIKSGQLEKALELIYKENMPVESDPAM